MLVLDERPDPAAGPTAGFHALIVGVSVYPNLVEGVGAAAAVNLGLEQLESPALTAYRVYQWLIRYAQGLPVPLHTVRLLLAPSAMELAAEPGIMQAFAAGASDTANYADLQAAANAWREDAARHRDSMTLFFFCGHGLGGTGDDALMLFEDFGDPAASLLARAISITDLEQGMAPPPPGGPRTIGRRQVYLVDACRNRPPNLAELNSADVPTIWPKMIEPALDDRQLSILLATINDRRAYAGKPGQATVFGQALLECLEGAAAETVEVNNDVRWAVSTADVTKYLQARMDERARALRVSQAFRPGRQNLAVHLVTFMQTPTVVVTFPVGGATAADNLWLQHRYSDELTDIRPLEMPPREYALPMGYYEITFGAIAAPPPGSMELRRILRPPRREIVVDF